MSDDWDVAMTSAEAAQADGVQAAAPFGMATCLNCGDRFFPDSDPNEMFCGPDCGQQYNHGLGL